MEILEYQNKEKFSNGYVTYPYNVIYPYRGKECNQTFEQIDGAISVNGLYSLVEFKDYSDASIKVEPLAKLRNILARRHGNVFGMFFSITPYTAPAQIQVQFMVPQIIILWSVDDIDYCIENSKFIECMEWKYKCAIERCEYNLRFSVNQDSAVKCDPLF